MYCCLGYPWVQDPTWSSSCLSVLTHLWSHHPHLLLFRNFSLHVISPNSKLSPLPGMFLPDLHSSDSFTEMSPLQRDLSWPENPKSFLSQHIILIFCRAVIAIWCFSCLRVCLFSVYPHEDASSSEAGALPCLELYFLEQKEVCSQKVWLATLMECICAWVNGRMCADHKGRGVLGTQGAVAFGDVVLRWLLSHFCADLSFCPGDWVYKN